MMVIDERTQIVYLYKISSFVTDTSDAFNLIFFFLENFNQNILGLPFPLLFQGKKVLIIVIFSVKRLPHRSAS